MSPHLFPWYHVTDMNFEAWLEETERQKEKQILQIDGAAHIGIVL